MPTSDRHEFVEHDLVLNVVHHETHRYCEHPDQNFFLQVYEKGVFRGNVGGHEHSWQATLAAESIRRGMELSMYLQDPERRPHRTVLIIETDTRIPAHPEA